jgi:hypothetical protein
MRTPHALAALVLVAAASPAAAQLQNRSISVESTVSAPLATAAGAHAGVGLAATAWLEGAAEAVVRLRLGTAPQPGGRASATSVSGTAGIRLSLLPDPLRPQLGLELGWARLGGRSGAQDRIAFGVAAGLEWFPARDLSLTARAALCGAGSALSAELALAVAAYF